MKNIFLLAGFLFIILLGFIGETSGLYFIGGETISCLFRFFNFTYSSNVKFISFPLKFTLKFLGKLAFKTGAIVSFKPPEIDPRLAHPITVSANKIKINGSLFFNMRYKI